MYISDIELSHFGKFENLNLSFDENFHVIYGPNESGKSTLTYALFGLLYDFIKPGKKTLVYALPKSLYISEDFPTTGQMTLRAWNRQLKILRRFTRGREEARLFEGGEDVTEELGRFHHRRIQSFGESLFGVSGSTYLSACIIRQEELRLDAEEKDVQKSLIRGAFDREEESMIRAMEAVLEERKKARGTLRRQKSVLGNLSREREELFREEESLLRLVDESASLQGDLEALRRRREILLQEFSRAEGNRRQELLQWKQELEERTQDTAPRARKESSTERLLLGGGLVLLGVVFLLLIHHPLRFLGLFLLAAGLWACLPRRKAKEEGNLGHFEAEQLTRISREIRDFSEDLPVGEAREYEVVKKELLSVEAQIDAHTKSLGRYEKALLELQQIQERLAQVEEAMDSQEDAADVDLVLRELLDEAKDEILRERQEDFEGLMKSYLRRLTCEAHPKASLSEAQLSTATKDQYALAHRLAMAEILAPGAPLVLDDVLNHFDETRKREALALFREISSTRQVIFLTSQRQDLPPPEWKISMMELPL